MQYTVEEQYLMAKRALFDRVYASLNDRQREAVYTVNNPLLVLAGAGVRVYEIRNASVGQEDFFIERMG